MNARDYKSFRKDHYYHVYNRGNNKEDIFKDSYDYINFLKRFKIGLGISEVPTRRPQRGSLGSTKKQKIRIVSLPENSFTILAYCLMPNHFHFLIRQNSDLGIDRLMAKICSSYAWYFNQRYDRVGNVFQDHFKAKLINSDRYLTYLSAYIHNNPPSPASYPFSSMQTYSESTSDDLCDTSIILKYFGNNRDAYRKFVYDFSSEQLSSLKDLLFKE